MAGGSVVSRRSGVVVRVVRRAGRLSRAARGQWRGSVVVVWRAVNFVAPLECSGTGPLC